LESKGSCIPAYDQEGTSLKHSYLDETIIDNQLNAMRVFEEKILTAENCPVRQVLDRIGDKWSTLVILMLGKHGKLRFNELSNAIGDVSQKMLTVTLRSLEADGLVSRKMYAEIPPRVEYELTEMGASLLPLIKALEGWAEENIGEIKRSRAQFSR
jgi:DNA-binding HxlR family transcriptional regulator